MVEEPDNDEDEPSIVKGVYVDLGPKPLVDLKVRFAHWLQRRGW